MVGVGLSFAVTLTVIAIYMIEGFEFLELRSYDLRMNLRGPRNLPTRVLMVLNDEQTALQLGVPPSRVSRAQYAASIKNLKAAGAALIVFDVMFTGRTTSSDDQALERAIRDAGNVILVRYLGEGRHVVPLEEYRAVELGEGFINMDLDSDGVLRSIPFLAFAYDGKNLVPYLTLGAEVARLFLDPHTETLLDLDIPDVAQFGALGIPYPNGKMFINYAGPPGTFPSVPLWKIVRGDFESKDVKGKIVLIGAHAATLHDSYRTPFSRPLLKRPIHNETAQQHVRMTGVETHANVLQTILDQDFIERLSLWLTYVLIAMVGLVCWVLVILYPQTPMQVVGIGVLVFGLLMMTSIFLFINGNIWLEVVPLLAVVNGHFAVGMGYQRYLLGRQKEGLKRMFSQYVSPQVADMLWAQRALLLSGDRPSPQRLTVTTMMAGLEGYSEASEKVSEDLLLEWVNSYLDSMGELVVKYGGVIEEYGDGTIKAHFGVPLPRTTEDEVQSDAISAVQCSLEMIKEAKRVNAGWKKQGLPDLNLQIGMYTGPVMTGCIGNAERLKYTAMGESVQMAIKIQRWIKEANCLPVSCGVFAGGTTALYMNGKFGREKLGEMSLDEKDHSIEIFHLFGKDFLIEYD